MATEKRLIDLDAYEDFKTECLMETTPGLHLFDAGVEEGMERAAEWLDAQSTVDAVEVVHGRWDEIPNKYMSVSTKTGSYSGHATSCSVCHEVNPNVFKTNYCPNCGAKMDGDANA